MNVVILPAGAAAVLDQVDRDQTPIGTEMTAHTSLASGADDGVVRAAAGHEAVMPACDASTSRWMSSRRSPWPTTV